MRKLLAVIGTAQAEYAEALRLNSAKPFARMIIAARNTPVASD